MSVIDDSGDKKHFNPLSLYRERRWKSSSQTHTGHFNPLSLYRERPIDRRIGVTNMSFQSTLPIQGETQKDENGLTGMAFQSTLPIQGETASRVDEHIKTDISIHSPYTGRDYDFATRLIPIGISIHSPYTGRDACQRHLDDLEKAFQSTLPIQGETDFPDMDEPKFKFQSTLPIQGETVCDRCYQRIMSISIHSPYTGRDRSQQRSV